MFFDKLISYKQKVFFSIICSGLWIYFRTSENYNMIPRHNIFPVVFVMGWTYLNYYEPLFLPIGLSILIAYSKLGWMLDSTEIKTPDTKSNNIQLTM
uniref:Uncharacterized protein n=1 Tax=viral metagenome TaxID=1070528 RepID=A0A6C0JW35_9ZZZZ